MNKLLCLAAILLLLLSCSKSDNPTPPPPPPPPPPVDADSIVMKTGWSNKLLANTLLSDVTWIDANHLAILAPNKRQIFNSTDGGMNWAPLSTYAYGVNIISRPNGRLYWATGLPNFTWIYRYQNGIADSVNLNKVAPDLIFLDDNIGYASLTSAPGLAQTHNGGDTWEPVTTHQANFGASYYSTLSFLDSIHGLISFDNKVYYTNEGTGNWHQSTINIPAFNMGCTALEMLPPNLAYAGFQNGTLFRSIDTGMSFTPIQLPLANSQQWLDFQFLDATNGYLCYGNVILRTTDGGNNWDTVVYDKKQKFIELEFLDAHHGAAVADSGRVFMFKN